MYAVVAAHLDALLGQPLAGPIDFVRAAAIDDWFGTSEEGLECFESGEVGNVGAAKEEYCISTFFRRELRDHG